MDQLNFFPDPLYSLNYDINEVQVTCNISHCNSYLIKILRRLYVCTSELSRSFPYIDQTQ